MHVIDPNALDNLIVKISTASKTQEAGAICLGEMKRTRAARLPPKRKNIRVI
jgi:hypothetical protein